LIFLFIFDYKFDQHRFLMLQTNSHSAAGAALFQKIPPYSKFLQLQVVSCSYKSFLAVTETVCKLF
jgi:hypothetical protein